MTLPQTAPAAKMLPIGKREVTLRQVVHISQGGKRMRVTFTNEFGTTPLRIDAAHVAFLSTGSRILTNTDHALSFSGQTGVTIPAGKFVSSDSVSATIPIFSDLVISMVVPKQDIPDTTYHAAAHTTTYIAAGNQVSTEQFLPPTVPPPGLTAPDVTAPIKAPVGQIPIVKSDKHPGTETDTGTELLTRTTSWYFLRNVEVNRTRKSAAVVALGDSITDGTGSTTETNRRWPDVLAPLLAANKKSAAFSVVNEGIGGNRILREGTGPSALERFQNDVLDQPGGHYVLMLEGINDIGNMHRSPADAITEQQLVDAFTTLASRAHRQGMRFIPATILPYKGAKYFSVEGEQIREEVNTFIRTSKLFDGFIDFDKATRDPDHPDQLQARYDSGDHLHPSDAGYAAMGASINLRLFRKK